MAQAVVRLRRVLSLSSNILHHTRLAPNSNAAVTATKILSSPLPSPSAPLTRRQFHSTNLLSRSSASRSFSDIDKIDPDTILFEGCDYKHWLIVMDFGKDPSQRPPPDQMVETYVQTAAKVLGSVEEAKKKIYACSTTTYTGFQVEVDEETSQKFEGLPGVIFVLPDSYIDPANKEYGGDKYINGEIIHRPPPGQFARSKRGDRQFDRRPRDPMTNQQRDPVYNQQRSVPRDGGHYMPQGPQQGFSQQQNYQSLQSYPPQQNYGSFGRGDRGNPTPIGAHHPSGGSGYHGGRTSDVPPHQGNDNHGYNYPQSHMSSHPGPQGGYAPQGQFSNYSGGHAYNNPQGQMGNHPGDHGYTSPQGQMGNHPGDRGYNNPRGHMDNRPGDHGYNNPQGQMGSRPGDFGGYTPQGQNNYCTPSPGAGAYGPSGAGPYGPDLDGCHSQGASTGFGVRHMPNGENQLFPQTPYEQSNIMEHRDSMPGTLTGFNQARN